MAYNTRIDIQLQKEIEALKRKLQRVGERPRAQSNRAFKEAARILISAIQGRAPESDKVHWRYETGGGAIVAEYHPGNLKRSFKALVFRQSEAVFVGPKLDKGKKGGIYKGAKVDGFYAHWMEFGAPEAGIPPRPFVRPAVDAAGKTTLKFAAELLKREIQKGDYK